MISIVRLIDALGITDEAEIAPLESWLAAALAFVNTQTRRYFGPVEEAEEFLTGRGRRDLWLAEPPTLVDAYDAVSVSEVAYPGADSTDILEGSESGFDLRIAGHEGKLVRRGPCGVWTRGYEYVVRYPRGYEEDAGPKDIEDVLIELVRLRQSAAGEEVMKSESIGGYSFTRFDSDDVGALPTEQQRTLKSWTRPVFG